MLFAVVKEHLAFYETAAQVMPGDSESNMYDCRVVARCSASVPFFVPRAGVPSRVDADPLPASSHPLRPPCRRS